MIRSELKPASAVETMLVFVRSERKMNIFYIIGVVVVISVVAGFFGLHV
jgi:mannose/fructose/N-acetylgalactosamine-specific phosphotransferase system component IID